MARLTLEQQAKIEELKALSDARRAEQAAKLPALAAAYAAAWESYLKVRGIQK